MDHDGQGLSSRIVTIPNILSLIRLALVPVFLVLILREQDIAAFVVIVVASVTDWLDGQIARRFDQMTRLGRVLDPAADRLFIFATLLGLAIRGVLPWWLVGAIIARDLVLLVLGVVLANAGYGPLQVHRLGKLATFVLLFALPLVMLAEAVDSPGNVLGAIAWAAVLWGAFLYWWAGAVYVRETVRLTSISRG